MDNTESQAQEDSTQTQDGQAAEDTLKGLQQYMLGLTSLIELEVRQALASLPALLGLSLCVLPLLLLSWIAASVLVAYFGYSLYPSVLLAIGIFLVLQLFALALVRYKIRQCLQRLSMPHSRSELSALIKGGFLSESQPTDSTATPKASTTTH